MTQRGQRPERTIYAPPHLRHAQTTASVASDTSRTTAIGVSQSTANGNGMAAPIIPSAGLGVKHAWQSAKSDRRSEQLHAQPRRPLRSEEHASALRFPQAARKPILESIAAVGSSHSTSLSTTTSTVKSNQDSMINNGSGRVCSSESDHPPLQNDSASRGGTNNGHRGHGRTFEIELDRESIHDRGCKANANHRGGGSNEDRGAFNRRGASPDNKNTPGGGNGKGRCRDSRGRGRGRGHNHSKGRDVISNYPDLDHTDQHDRRDSDLAEAAQSHQETPTQNQHSSAQLAKTDKLSLDQRMGPPPMRAAFSPGSAISPPKFSNDARNENAAVRSRSGSRSPSRSARQSASRDGSSWGSPTYLSPIQSGWPSLSPKSLPQYSSKDIIRTDHRRTVSTAATKDWEPGSRSVGKSNFSQSKELDRPSSETHSASILALPSRPNQATIDLSHKQRHRRLTSPPITHPKSPAEQELYVTVRVSPALSHRGVELENKPLTQDSTLHHPDHDKLDQKIGSRGRGCGWNNGRGISRSRDRHQTTPIEGNGQGSRHNQRDTSYNGDTDRFKKTQLPARPAVTASQKKSESMLSEGLFLTGINDVCPVSTATLKSEGDNNNAGDITLESSKEPQAANPETITSSWTFDSIGKNVDWADID
ncbi:hypothetical protein BASA61_000716 [Batrachochytrium salamandrivorans]|nr:hypothetical protein BASA61_000716 [Batrachochytrium salamandrivorans]KAH9253807.1 hypothetical protein BASA81_008241 [Batrachochytrium salamandrivorans]KAH9273287.1 hypothetical protein BASA83_004282 [Batrachochytrium salamandrivorans]